MTMPNSDLSVKVYYNLHKHVFSLQCARTRRVVAHRNYVVLKDVTFKVSEAGRKRVIAQGAKNVHAFVCGSVVEQDDPIFDIVETLHNQGNGTAVYYNPYTVEKFVIKKDKSTVVERAKYVILDSDDRSVTAFMA